ITHVPLLNVMFQPLAGLPGGMVVSWNSGSTAGSTNARQVYPTGDLTQLPIIGLYRAQDINIFWTNISVTHPLNVSNPSTLNSSLNAAQQTEWATIQSSMNAILSTSSTPSTLDTPGQALETNRAAMFWRFKVDYPDTDGDGIEDWKEIAIYHTNPFSADTDGDGFTDAEELRLGTDFNDSNSKPAFLYTNAATPDPAEVHIQRWSAYGWVLDEDGQHQDAKWFAANAEKGRKSWNLNGSQVNARMREGVAWLQGKLNKCEFGPAIANPDSVTDVTNLVASDSEGHPEVQGTLWASTDWYHPYTYIANDRRAAMRIIAAQTATTERIYTYLVCKNKYSVSESADPLRSPDVMGTVTFTIPAGKLIAVIAKSAGVTDDVVKIKNNVLYLAAPLTESVAEGADENYTRVFLTPIEVNINDTADTKDDIVRKEQIIGTTAWRQWIPCTVKITGAAGAQITSIGVTAENGTMKFAQDSATPPNNMTAGSANATATLDAQGQARFWITGITQSAAKGDAKLQIRRNAITGDILASKPMTVFWFDAKITFPSQVWITTFITSYGLEAPQQSWTFLGETTIKPTGLDCTASQIARMKLGFIQNVKTTRNWHVKTPAVKPGSGAPATATVTVATTRIGTVSWQDYVLDRRFPQTTITRDQTPLYDGYTDFDASGKSSILNDDAPFSYADVNKMPALAVQGNQTWPVTVEYQWDKTVIKDDFLLWLGIADDTENDGFLSNPPTFVPIRQVDWHLNADSSVNGPQAPSGGTHKDPDIIPVINGQTANTLGGSQDSYNPWQDGNQTINLPP
ncbi:MAG: thrombospondin type 3 repeat-containing protein, partial [Verrucomicrobiaceae bacterium]